MLTIRQHFTGMIFTYITSFSTSKYPVRKVESSPFYMRYRLGIQLGYRLGIQTLIVSHTVVFQTFWSHPPVQVVPHFLHTLLTMAPCP